MSRIGEITVGQKRKNRGWVKEEKSKLGRKGDINQGLVDKEKSRL